MEGVSRRRDAIAAAAAGSVLFLVSSLVVRGGLLDSAPYGDVHLFRHYANLMASGKWPYHDFFDEYPPFAQLVFLPAHVLPGPYATAFKATMAVFGVTAVVLLVAALGACGASRLRLFVAASAAGFAPLLVGPIFLNSFDLWPAVLMAAALFALARGRSSTAFTLLALAATAKLYPYAALPVVCIWAWRRGGKIELRRGLAAFIVATVVVMLPFAVVGAGGLGYSYRVQAARGLEIQSLGASVILAAHRLQGRPVSYGDRSPGGTEILGGGARVVAAVTSLVEAVAVLAVALLYARRRLTLFQALAGAVLAAVAFAKVFSPQYVDWLVPLVPAAGVAESFLLLPALLLTRYVFDDQDAIHHTGSAAWLLLARNLCIVGLYALVVARARNPATSST